MAYQSTKVLIISCVFLFVCILMQFLVKSTFFDDLESRRVIAFAVEHQLVTVKVGEVESAEVIRRTTMPSRDRSKVEDFVVKIGGKLGSINVTVRASKNGGDTNYELTARH